MDQQQIPVSEYVTRQDLEEVLNRTLDQRDETLIRRVETMVAAQVADEAQHRRDDIAGIRSDLKSIESRIDTKLGGIEVTLSRMGASFEAVTDKLSQLAVGVERSNGVIDGIKSIVTSNEANYRDLTGRVNNVETYVEGRVDRLQGSVDLITSNQAVLNNRQDVMHRAIFGGADDGPKSIYALLSDIVMRLNSVLDVSGSNRQAIEAIREAERLRAERWSRRRAAVLGLLRQFVGSRAGIAVGVGIVGALSATAGAEIINLIEQMLK